MNYITQHGIEIIDDDSVPECELRVLAPGPKGMKVEYRFGLNDCRLARVSETGRSFIDDLIDWITRLDSAIRLGDLYVAQSINSLLLTNIQAFRVNKYTPNHNNDLPPWLTEILDEENNDGT